MMKENYSILKAANRAVLKKSSGGQYGLEVTKFDENGNSKTEIIELNLEEIKKELADTQSRVSNLSLLVTDIESL